jgi:hypothetical protein
MEILCFVCWYCKCTCHYINDVVIQWMMSIKLQLFCAFCDLQELRGVGSYPGSDNSITSSKTELLNNITTASTTKNGSLESKSLPFTRNFKISNGNLLIN